MNHLLINRILSRRLISWLFIVSIFFTLANNILFIHSHLKADGTIEIHAHPYNKTGDKAPFKTHFHSDAQFAAIQWLSLLFAAAAYLMAALLPVLLLFFWDKEQSCFLNQLQLYSQLRAPPLCQVCR